MKTGLQCALLAWFWLAAGISAALADQWKGMDMVRYCTGDTVLFDDSVCRAYIQGVVDAHERYSNKNEPAFCLPGDAAGRKKGESLVPKWLAAFQERWRQKPIELTADALKAIFPCREARER